MLYLGIFIVLVLLLLIIPVNVASVLKIDDKTLKFSMKIYIFKKLRIYFKSIDIPDIFSSKPGDEKKEAAEKLDKCKEKENKRISALSKFNIMVTLYCSNKERFIKLKNYIKKKLKLRDIDVYMAEGTGDAAITGIVYGLLWSFFGSLSGVLSNFLTLSYKNLSLNCDYNNKTFKFHISSILTFSIVNIIIVYIRLNYIIKRYKLSVKKL